MFITFIALIALFLWMGYYYHGKSAKAKFTSFTIILSLAAANLSFSGAVLAVLYSASVYREWALVLPFAFGLAMFLIYLTSEKSSQGGLTLSEMNLLFKPQDSSKSKFAVYYAFAWFFFLALLIGWELYVASQVLSPVLFHNSNPFTQFILAIVCIAVICTYTYFGGVSAIIKSDTIQIALGVLCCILIWSNWDGPKSSPPFFESIKSFEKTSDCVWFAIELVAINICFQVPQRMYWHYLQISKESNLSAGKILFGGTAIPFVIWLFFIWVGISYTAQTKNLAYPDLVAAKQPWQGWILLMAVIGFTFSTIDSYLLSAGLTLRELRQIYHVGKNTPLPESPTRTLFVFIIGILSISLTFILMKFVSNIFQSFLAISGAMGAFAPVVLLPMFRKNLVTQTWVRSELRASLLFLLFVLSCSVQLIIFISDIQHGTPIVVVLTILLAFVIFLPPSKQTPMNQNA